MKAMQLYACVAVAALVLAACSGKGDDSAASTPAAPDASTTASQPRQAGPAAAPVAGPGDMQALLAKLVAPAHSATEAAAQFTWVGGNDPKPAGALAGSMDALNQAVAQSKSRLEAVAAQARVTSLPPGMAALANDPKAQEAMEKKLDGMSQQEKIAWAMQMASQQAGQMQPQMQQQAEQATEENDAAEEKFANDLQQISLKRVRDDAPLAQILAERDQLDRKSQAAHEAIDRDLEAAIRQIPLQQEGEDGSGCYNTANAHRVYDLRVQGADKQVAQADKDLAQAAQWAGRYRAMLEPEAREDDGLQAELATIGHSVMQATYTLQAGQVLDTTLAHFKSYLQGVRDSDLHATKWVRAREQKRKQDWSLWDCGTNHG